MAAAIVCGVRPWPQDGLLVRAAQRCIASSITRDRQTSGPEWRRRPKRCKAKQQWNQPVARGPFGGPCVHAQTQHEVVHKDEAARCAAAASNQPKGVQVSAIVTCMAAAAAWAKVVCTVLRSTVMAWGVPWLRKKILVGNRCYAYPSKACACATARARQTRRAHRAGAAMPRRRDLSTSTMPQGMGADSAAGTKRTAQAQNVGSIGKFTPGADLRRTQAYKECALPAGCAARAALICIVEQIRLAAQPPTLQACRRTAC